MNPIIRRLSSLLQTPHLSTSLRRLGSGGGGGDNDDWNDAWETAWLPPDKPTSNIVSPDPWDPPNNTTPTPSLSSPEADTETRAFVEDMNENWEQRRRSNRNSKLGENVNNNNEGEKKVMILSGGLESMKRDYRVKKQRIHAGLWVKEIEKREEARLMGDDVVGDSGDDIQRLLDSCSEIFDSPNADLDNSEILNSGDLKNKPDGWETTAKTQGGSVWEMSQREEDILLQEFERRIAFCKFQIASFIKTHIFSRRRPIDGWKYMIEEIGPNARKGKGSVSRLPSLSDEATQPFREERTHIANNGGYIKGR